MGFVAYLFSNGNVIRLRPFVSMSLIMMVVVCLSGCAGDQISLPSAEQLLEFENAGPPRPVVDTGRLVRARIGGGPYRVVPGDVLELTMPAVLHIVTVDEPDTPDRTAPFVCRVGETGTIALPVVGEIEVEGKSLGEIESAIVGAYHPKYALIRPSVFARVLEYETAEVSITGAVKKPGVFSMRNDQMSLVSLLMEAEGIIDEGAALIRIARAAETMQTSRRPVQSASAAIVDKAPRTKNRNGAALQAAEELLRSNTRKGMLLRPHFVSSEQVEVQLSFQRSDPKSTKGVLMVGYDGKRQRFKNYDIESDLHRQALLKYLVNKDQRFSTVAIESELIDFAEELRTIIGFESELAEMVKELRDSPASDDTIDRQPTKSVNSATNAGNWNTQQRPRSKPETLILPVEGLNIPFADVVLQDGDAVIVERFQQPLVTVVGLVNKAGNFPYPPDAQYNLMQALGFAGGLDHVAEPRYVTIYRMKPDRTIIHAIFSLVDGSRMTEALGILIKPGDIIAVEHTPRTRKNVFLDKVFRINLGMYVPLGDLWGSD